MATATKQTAKKIAAEAIAIAHKYGFKITRAAGCVVTIETRIQPGSQDDLVDADMTYGSVLAAIPTTKLRNQWGTDCGGIGAMSALKSGRFVMNQSGCRKAVVAAIARQLNQ